MDTGAKVCGTVEAEAWSGAFTTTLINTSDDSRAIHIGTTYVAAEISDFAFGIPVGATITGISAVAEFSHEFSGKVAYIRLSLSYDDGAHYTATQENNVTGTTDVSKTYGGAADVWGRAWTVAEFADGTFRVKVEAKDNLGAAYGTQLDYLAVTVYYTAVGGFFAFF